MSEVIDEILHGLKILDGSGNLMPNISTSSIIESMKQYSNTILVALEEDAQGLMAQYNGESKEVYREAIHDVIELIDKKKWHS